MVTLRIKLISLFCLTFHISGFSGFGQSESRVGLGFASHEVIKDKRTSLDLTPERAFEFPEGFYIEFDAKFRPGDGYYGYVFRIIGDEDTSIDLVANLGETSATNFSLILEDNVLFSYTWENIPNGAFGRWMKVKLHVDTQNSLISLSLNMNEKEKKVKVIDDLKTFNLIFGACRAVSFLTTDVAPMTLRDIRVYNSNGEIFRNWKLSKHADTEVYDEVSNAKATVQNPNWEINKHLQWKSERTFNISNLIGVTEDKTGGRIFLVNNEAVFIHNILEDAIDTLRFAGGQPFNCQGNQLIYNPYVDEIWSYNFDKSQLSIFDFKTNTWSLSDPGCKEPELWHHNKFISQKDTSLITFGGYGFYTYKALLRKFNTEDGKWLEIDLSDQIYPRYMSALGLYKNENILIFGGYGSKTGRQELSPEFYYDLYSIDQTNYSVEKLWTFDGIRSPFVPSTNLVLDPDSIGFYTMVYNPGNFQTSMRLAHFTIAEPRKTFYADSIGYKFLDTRSWSSLSLHKEANKLIALTLYDSEVTLHSLAFPPLLAKDVYQDRPTQAISNLWLSVVIGIVFVLFSVFIFFILYKKRLKAHPASESAKGTDSFSVIIPDKSSKITPSSIYLIGGFLTYDKNGEDITSSFTPTLKQLFLLIFLSGVKNGKGVSSVTLKDTLWFDKTGTSGRNNRNVNMSKLRTLLEKIGGIELESNKTYWKITCHEGVYCDYIEMIHLMEKVKSQDGLQPEEVMRLISIASSGDICPNVQTEWMDAFKASFANAVVDTLILICNSSPTIQKNNSLLCNVADCILKYDSLNEEAIRIKCNALYKMGKKGLAKHSFNSFSREYKNLLGDEVTFSFNKLIEQS